MYEGHDAIDAVHDSLKRQQVQCAQLGSSLYAIALEALSQDYVRGGTTFELLNGVSEKPVHDALPLRLLGGLHAIALSGIDTRLSGQFPSTGGAPTNDLADIVLTALQEHREQLSASVRRNVQTNEVGRSIVALSIARWLPTIGAQTCRWFEVGASAGLNLNFPRFHASTGVTAMGDETSSVSFGPDWFDSSPPHGQSAICVDLRGCDPFPIDVSRPSERLRLLSFVWPDQSARLDRLRRAIDIALEYPPRVDRAEAGPWLASFDASPRHDGEATVVYHSIVWQYLSPDNRQSLIRSLDHLASKSTPHRPVVWARMEPAGDMADIRVNIWTGDMTPVQLELGRVGYHGPTLRWSPRRLHTSDA